MRRIRIQLCCVKHIQIPAWLCEANPGTVLCCGDGSESSFFVRGDPRMARSCEADPDLVLLCKVDPDSSFVL